MRDKQSAGLQTTGTNEESDGDHDCEDCAALGDFPCWECYDAGRRGFGGEEA